MSRLLVINAGSSSIKYHVFDLHDLSVTVHGKIADLSDYNQAFRDIFTKTKELSLVAVAHRIVHGGEKYIEPVLVTDNVISYLRKLSGFAPLHQPHNLEAIDMIRSLRPDLPQYAAFDTAFHSGHNAVIDCYALPVSYRNMGLRRYGFHGLSYQYISLVIREKHPELADKKIVAAHLGNGVSLCAMKEGRSIDSTMGLTTLEGPPMGTRSGSVDPGLLLYLGQETSLSFDDISDLLYRQSGLLGLSGLTHDVKTLLESNDPQAKFALDVFCHKVSQHAAMMATSLGGMDALVFTGGIGENAARIRDNILNHLAYLPTFRTLTIPTNEEYMIARNIKDHSKL